MANSHLTLDTDALVTVTPVAKNDAGDVTNKGQPIEMTLEKFVSLISDAIGTSGGYLTDAPSDGTAYGRKDGAWVAVTEAA